jgi:hypothetical protein
LAFVMAIVFNRIDKSSGSWDAFLENMASIKLVKNILPERHQLHKQQLQGIAYIFCPYVISTLYNLLRELSKDIFSSTTLLTTQLYTYKLSNITPKRQELRCQCCFHNYIFIGH